jgi:signal peptidase
MRGVQHSLGIGKTVYIGLTVGLTYLFSLVIPAVAKGLFTYQVLSAVVWFSVSLFSIIVLKRSYSYDLSSRVEGGTSRALIAGLVFALTYFLLGSFGGGLGYSPLSYSPISFSINLFWVVMVAFGVESLRKLMLLDSEKPGSVILGTTILFTISLLPLRSMLASGEILVSSILLRVPLAGALLLSGMANYAYGVRAGYLSLLVPFGVITLSPILPAVTGPAVLFASALALLISYLVLSFTPGENSESRGIIWPSVIGFAVVLLIWFSNGFLGFHTVVVTSGSMRPGIDVGDLVIVRKPMGYSPLPGDIVLIKNGDSLVLHRVYKVDGDKIITKGDANKSPDPWISSDDQIIGRVIVKIPKAGWPSLWLKHFLKSI